MNTNGMKSFFYMLIAMFNCQVFFSQSWQNMIPNYSFEKQKPMKLDHVRSAYERLNDFSLQKNGTQINDSLKTLHGVALQYNLYHDFRIYTIGYEYSKRLTEYSLGSGLTFNYNKIVGYSSYTVGMRFFIELGNQFGTRIGFDGYYIWRPEVMNLEIHDIIPINTPMRQVFGIAPNLGCFFKTKNRKLQFLISMNFDHVIGQIYRYQDFQVVEKWSTPESQLNYGLTIKYNFQLK